MLVKNLLSTNQVNAARFRATKYLNTDYRDDIIALFKNIKPEPIFCKCGKRLNTVFVNSNLSYSTRKKSCYDCEKKAEEEWARQRAEMIKAEAAAIEAKKKEAKEEYDRFIDNKETFIDDLLKSFGVPSIFIHARNGSKQEAGNYFLTGNIGTGKTYLAVGLLRDYVKSLPEIREGGTWKIDIGAKPIFVTVPELLLDLRSCFDSSTSAKEKSLVDKYSKTPFLVLDDLGAEKTSEYALQSLYIILNTRYNEHLELKTVITSNLSLDDVSKYLNDRISSRINGMCKTLEFKGKDKRQKII